MSIQKYLSHHANLENLVHGDSPCWVVIPSKAEHEVLTATLDSLAVTEDFSVIVVVNGRDEDPDWVHESNQETLRILEDWSAYPLSVLDYASPGKRVVSGVGAARRVGMDAALRANPNAEWLLSLDADAPVGKTYIQQLESVPSLAVGALIEFAHPSLSDDMARYELWLRYIAEGLRQAGLPYAFVALGSIIAVRPMAYAAVRGMSTKDAGEDFHFLQKLAKHGPIWRFASPTVFPSARVSDRVPFGTGPALREVASGNQRYHQVEPAQAFREIAELVGAIQELYAGRHVRVSDSMQQWLATAGFDVILDRLKTQSTTPETFRRHFFHWFDGLKAKQYLNVRRAQAPQGLLAGCETLTGQTFADCRDALAFFRDSEPGFVGLGHDV